MCILYERVFRNNAMNSAKMEDNFQRITLLNKTKILIIFCILKDKYKNRSNYVID